MIQAISPNRFNTPQRVQRTAAMPKTSNDVAFKGNGGMLAMSLIGLSALFVVSQVYSSRDQNHSVEARQDEREKVRVTLSRHSDMKVTADNLDSLIKADSLEDVHTGDSLKAKADSVRKVADSFDLAKAKKAFRVAPKP